MARFYETEGRAAEVSWSALPIRMSQAQVTDLVERPLAAAKLVGGQVRFSIGPWQLVTLRLVR